MATLTLTLTLTVATLTLTVATLTAVTRTMAAPPFTPPPLIWQVHQAAVHACLCDNFNTAGAMTALLATCSDANSYVKVQRYSLLLSKRHT